MAYTIQLFSESGNWANPQGDDVKFAANLREVYDLFYDWIDTNERYNYAQDATALVWSERLEDVTDQYPDWQLTVGPRGGIRRNPC